MAGYTRQSTFADGDTITAALFNNEYNQLLNAFSNTSGHKHDGTANEGPVIGLIGDAGETSPNNKVLIDTTNNHIEFYVEVSSNPVQQIYIADGAIVPVTDSDVDIGTTSLRFKDAYIDTVTTTGNVSVGGNLTVTGTTTFNGGTITMGDAATDNVVFGADVDSHIIPDDDDTYDLGSSTQQWRNLYIDGTAEIDTLAINGTTVTSTAAELNILDGVTSTAAELNLLDGVTSTTAELNILDGVTSTTAELNILDGVTATAAEINTLDGITSTVAELNILDGVTASATDINLIDGITNGTVIASKAIVTDANKDISGGRNITITGELDAATLDISGNADIDGTLETDALSINGTTVTSTAAELNILDGVTATAAEINLLDGVTSTTAELNILDGVTSTAAELNLLDGVTATTAELNILDGVTSTAAELNILDGKAFLDEDDMSSNSATGIASQQSIKAYVDTTVAATNEVVEDSTPQLGGDLDLNSNDITGTGNINITGTIQSSGNITGTLATAAQTNITSLGTLTSLTGGTGDLNWDSGTLFVDSSANVVGIGETSPQAGLDIASTAKGIFTSGNVYSYPTGNAYIKVKGTNAEHNWIGIAGGYEQSSGSANLMLQPNFRLTSEQAGNYIGSEAQSVTTADITFGKLVGGSSTSTNATKSEFMRITSGGNVGIGTSSPDSKLEIEANDSTNNGLTSLLTLSHTTTGTAADGIGTRIVFNSEDDGGTKSTMGYIDTLFTDVSDGAEKSAIQFYTRSGGSIARQMHIDSTGVGIGTDSPYHTFDVFGDVIANGQAKSNGLFFDTTSATTGTGGGIALGGYSNGTGGAIYHFGNIQGIKENSTAGNYASAMLFSTRANGATPTERMRIDSSGNLLVARTSDSGFGKLQVYGGADLAGGNVLLCRDTGNVGIGTSSPNASADLHIADTSDTRIWVEATSGDTAELYAGTGVSLFNRSNSFLNFGTNNTERMRIDSSGDVRLAANATGAALLKGVSGDQTSRNVGGYPQFTFVGNEGTGMRRPITNILAFDTSGDERMRIDDSGNVGIGNSSPSAKLTINNSIATTYSTTGYAATAANSMLYLNNTHGGSNTASLINFRTGSGDGVIGFVEGGGTNDADFVIQTDGGSNGVERLRITNSGNVGIGTSSPDANLSVSGDGLDDSSPTIRLTNTFSSGSWQSFGGDIGRLEFFTEDTSGEAPYVTGRITSNNDALSGSRTLPSGALKFFTRGYNASSLTLAMTLSSGGALSKASGSFKIDHPLESKKDTHHLVHSFVEAPQADNIYRGVVTLVDGGATINLDTEAGMTEGTFVLLNTNTSCFTSNESDWDAVKGSVSGNILTISCQNTSSTATVSWLVIGERHDQHMIDTDWTDENGKVIVEPLKGETE